MEKEETQLSHKNANVCSALPPDTRSPGAHWSSKAVCEKDEMSLRARPRWFGQNLLQNY